MRQLPVVLLLLAAACGRTGIDGPVDAGPSPTATPGQLDPAFGTQGVSRTELTGVQVRSAAISAGKILVAGTAETDWIVARFLANGSLDTTFANGGVLRVNEQGNGTLSDFVVLPDGRFVLAGSWDDEGSITVSIRRFLADGSADAGFSVSRTINWNASVGRAIAIAVAPNGDVFFARSRDEGSNRTRFFVEKLDSAGANVSTFSGDGVAQVDVNANDGAWPVGIAVDAANRVLIAGIVERGAQHDLLVSRFLADGSLDPAWGTAGTSEVADADDDRPAALALHADGSVTVGGATQVSTLLCAGFSAAGAFEGRATMTGSRPADGVYAVHVQSDGALVIAGSRDDRFVAARVLPDGTADTSLAVALASPFPAAATSVVPDGGAYLFAGGAANEIVLARWIN